MQIEHNILKNLNWPEANQLSIYKRGRGFQHGVTLKWIQVVVRAGLDPVTAGLRARHADHSALAGHDRLVVIDEGADGHSSWYDRRKTLQEKVVSKQWSCIAPTPPPRGTTG